VVNGSRPGSDPAEDRGGALRWNEPLAAGELTVTDSVFEGNDAAQASAIDANTTGAHAITDTVVSGGFSFDLGAVFAAGPLTLTRSAIRDNTGGGVVADHPGPAALAISSSAVADNRFGTAESRGGVYARGDATIENSTITGNSGGYVGGVWPDGELTVRFTTIAGNAGLAAGGNAAGGIDVQSSDGVALDGVIIAGNQLGTNPAPSNCNQPAGITEGPNPNLESADDCGLDTGPGQGSIVNTDPLLAPVADNGGPTPTRALYEGSPAIDAALAACSEPFDQRGVARPAGAACDIGAFEGSVPAPVIPPAPAPAPTAPPGAKKKAKKCKKGGRRGARCKGKRRRSRSATSPAAGPRVVIGRSVRGRPIVATRLGEPAAPRVALVVGVIHGDERAGLGVTRMLRRGEAVEGLQLWLIDDLNPDGSRERSRRNARGVDLNRNFPYRWRGGVPASSGYFPGRAPASEPETQAAMAFIEQIDPDLSIWYHQPWGAVLACRGRPAAAARYARLAGARTSCRGRGLPGTAINWERATIPAASAFVVELPAGALSERAAGRHARAAIAVAAEDGP
jgi:protein MpaA